VVFAAASLKEALAEAVNKYDTQTGDTAKISYAASWGPRCPAPCPSGQWTGPDGVVFASCAIASMIRCQVGAPLSSSSSASSSARSAFLERSLAVTLEHQVRRAPDIDLRDHHVGSPDYPCRSVTN